MPSRILLHRIWSPAGDNEAVTSAKEKRGGTEFRTLQPHPSSYYEANINPQDPGALATHFVNVTFLV